MALRDQPYIPLYVQDYLTDEKLNMCSWATQGIYIKILCVLHKQTEYGCILFKQKDKQNFSKSLNFASVLVKHIPCQIDDMVSAIDELIEYNVLSIEGNKMLQRRMVKDNEVSLVRSMAGKKGGGNPILFKQKDKQVFKQKDKQNPEYEIEYENEYVFDVFKEWLLYKKEIKKGYKSQKSVQMAYNHLVELSDNDAAKAKKIIDQSITHGWTGLFEIKVNSYKQQDTRKSTAF